MSTFKILADLAAVDFSAELADEPLRFAIGLGHGLYARGGTAFLTFALEFGDVPASAAAGKTTRLIQIAQLNGLVTVPFLRFHLEDVAGARLNDGHRNHFTGGVENLRHPDLAAE